MDNNILLLAGYAPTTVNKYTNAVHRFSSWCAALGITTNTHRQLDHAMARYFVDLWLTKKGKAEASCVLYGMDMLDPGVKLHLVRSRRSLRGFNRLQPSTPHPPMPWTVAVVLSFWLAARGKGSMAIGVLLSFDCYLRVGELIHLVREDFATAADARLGMDDRHHRMCINLRRTKTGDYKGVEILNHQVRTLMDIFLKSIQPGQRVFQFHESTYRKWFHRGCMALQVSSDYVPHSLRHGGATRDYHHGMPLADVMLRGRWAATKSATHYIQQGRQLMMLRNVPSWVDQAGRVIDRFLVVSIIIALSQVTR